jgi:thioredoxin 1
MVEVHNQQELQQLLERNEKVLVLFYASWCPYCLSFVSVFDKKVINFNSGSKRVIHVLINDYDNPLWDDYDIEAVPSVMFFEKGKVSKRLDGKLGVGLSEKQLRDWLQEL